MSENSTPPSSPELPRLTTLSPKARIVVDAIMDAWLDKSETAQQVIAQVGRSKAREALEQMLDVGHMVVRQQGEGPNARFWIEATDAGREFFGLTGERH